MSSRITLVFFYRRHCSSKFEAGSVLLWRYRAVVNAYLGRIIVTSALNFNELWQFRSLHILSYFLWILQYSVVSSSLIELFTLAHV